MRYLLCLAFAISLTAATRTASNDAEFRNALDASTGGDVILLSYDVSKIERFLDNKTFSPALTIRAAGNSGSLVCANAANDDNQANCYIENVNGVIFDGLAIDGGINGKGWRDVTFQNLRAWNRGRVSDGALLKQSTDCRNISVLDSTFDGHARTGNATDMIDLIECDDSKVIGNKVILGPYRAFVQTKGGSTGDEIAWNTIEGGLRPLQLGGQFGSQSRPSALLDADVHDNYIKGGQSCMTISGVNGLKIRRNTCEGQTTYVFRVLIEQASIDPNQNVEIAGNAILDFKGVPVNFVNQSSGANHHDWSTIKHGPNLYTTEPRWPAEAFSVGGDQIRAAAAGPAGVLTDASLAERFGVTGEPTDPTEPTDPVSGGGLYWTVAPDGTVTNWSTYAEARTEAMKDPCSIKLYRAVGGVAIDFEQMRYSGAIELVPVVTLPEIEPEIGYYHVPGIPFEDLRVFEIPEPVEAEQLAACCGPWCESQQPGVILRGCLCANWLGDA